MYETLKEYIKQNEGLRLEVYLDSLGKRTIGYGHLMRPQDKFKKITLQQANDLFEEDFQKHLNEAEEFPGFEKLTYGQKCAIIDMTFNMGKFWTNFPKFTRYLNEGKLQLAANEIRSSRYARQVGRRAKNNIDLILGKKS